MGPASLFQRSLEKVTGKIVKIRKELANIKQTSRIKDVEKRVREELTELIAYVEKLEQMKPTCTEPDAELRFNIYVDDFVNPCIEDIKKLRNKLSDLKKATYRELASLKRIEDKQLKEIEIRAELLSRLSGQDFLQDIKRINGMIKELRDTLKAKYEALNETYLKLEELENSVDEIAGKLAKLKENLHDEVEETTIEKYRELPASKPDEYRVQEYTVVVLRCKKCGKELGRKEI